MKPAFIKKLFNGNNLICASVCNYFLCVRKIMPFRSAVSAIVNQNGVNLHLLVSAADFQRRGRFYSYIGNINRRLFRRFSPHIRLAVRNCFGAVNKQAFRNRLHNIARRLLQPCRLKGLRFQPHRRQPL